MLTLILSDVVLPDPTDAVPPKWGAYAVMGAAALGVLAADALFRDTSKSDPISGVDGQPRPAPKKDKENPDTDGPGTDPLPPEPREDDDGERFYSVQDSTDYARLLHGGEPWPTDPIKGHLGVGLYAWETLADAQAYRSGQWLRPEGPSQVVALVIDRDVLLRFRTIDLTKDPDAAERFVDRHSRLFGDSMPHDYQHVIRQGGNSSYGPEH